MSSAYRCFHCDQLVDGRQPHSHRLSTDDQPELRRPLGASSTRAANCIPPTPWVLPGVDVMRGAKAREGPSHGVTPCFFLLRS